MDMFYTRRNYSLTGNVDPLGDGSDPESTDMMYSLPREILWYTMLLKRSPRWTLSRYTRVHGIDFHYILLGGINFRDICRWECL